MRYADSFCDITDKIIDGKQVYVVTGPCYQSDKTHTVLIPAPELYAYRQGKSIQAAMPSVSASDREYLISGIHPDDWDRFTIED